MHCWELGTDVTRQGLRVQALPEPHVNLTEDGEFFFSINPKEKELLERVASTGEPFRAMHLEFEAGKDFFSFCSPASNKALVLLNIRDPAGGKIALTAANDRGELCTGEQVSTSFGPFPSVGIELVGGPTNAKSWERGAEHLVLCITMLPGASFRILRTRLMMESYIKWNGTVLRTGTTPSQEKGKRRSKSFATLRDVMQPV